MFCPNCGAEFRDEIDQCADCGVPLVAESPQGGGSDPVVLLRTPDTVELSVVKSLLQAEGIAHFVQGEESLHMLPIAGHGGFFSKHGLSAAVLVPEDQLDRAREVLAAQVPPDPDPEPEPGSE
ncbi:MAG: DUF2007 domain-containing protein [Acidobacteriota bacterium]